MANEKFKEYSNFQLH